MSFSADQFEFSPDVAHNAAALDELVGAIAFGQGTDDLTLLLVRCNYARLRERLLDRLVAQLGAEELQGEVHVLRLGAADRNLYAQVQAAAQQQRPGAVIVVELEAINGAEALLVEVNKRREEFRQDFHFPLVMWFTDETYHQLSKFANDFESIAAGETIEFTLPQGELMGRLRASADGMFEALLARDRSLCQSRFRDCGLQSAEPLNQAFKLFFRLKYPQPPHGDLARGIDKAILQMTGQLFGQQLPGGAFHWRFHHHMLLTFRLNAREADLFGNLLKLQNADQLFSGVGNGAVAIA